MDYASALAIAHRAEAALAPYGQCLSIAGSIRRQRSSCKDVELVCIPRLVPTGLFGDELVVDPDFCAAVNQWPAVKGQPTGKYTQRRLPEGMLLDLFRADADNWGWQLALRTGSSEYNQSVLLPQLKQAGYAMVDGYIERHGQRVPVREEGSLFALMGLAWVDPKAREVH